MANEKSDCTWAEGEPDQNGLFWCAKLGRMVTGAEKGTCEHYTADK
jgi:hypothetical protein